jgi:hypothetical protein
MGSGQHRNDCTLAAIVVTAATIGAASTAATRPGPETRWTAIKRPPRAHSVTLRA